MDKKITEVVPDRPSATKQAVDAAGTIVTLPPKLIGALADEVARTVVGRINSMRITRKKNVVSSKAKQIERAIFLDTSAIIDGRIFEVVNLGLITGVVVLLESILLELKHIADSQDVAKRERGKKGLELLDKLKRTSGIKVVVLPEYDEKFYAKHKIKEVDEKLIKIAKLHKGRIITCDYNLEKKASISGGVAINVNALAHALKVTAVPGEALHMKVQHLGKDITQGVGYLDDGTMVVIEHGSADITKTIDVVISRVIQTAAGRILFAKKI